MCNTLQLFGLLNKEEMLSPADIIVVASAGWSLSCKKKPAKNWQKTCSGGEIRTLVVSCSLCCATRVRELIQACLTTKSGRSSYHSSYCSSRKIQEFLAGRGAFFLHFPELTRSWTQVSRNVDGDVLHGAGVPQDLRDPRIRFSVWMHSLDYQTQPSLVPRDPSPQSRDKNTF